jgi:hypothetical protein
VTEVHSFVPIHLLFGDSLCKSILERRSRADKLSHLSRRIDTLRSETTIPKKNQSIVTGFPLVEGQFCGFCWQFIS